MKVGLFGGSFDPVHLGHLLLAEFCRETCGLDVVRFLPAGDPPHKRTGSLSAARHRAEMLELATAGVPEFVVDRREFDRSGKSYTVDTLREFGTEHPDDELHFLIGGDSLVDLPTWRDPAGILELATIVAVNRGEEPLPAIDDLVERIGPVARDRIRLVSMPAIDLSSTAIRAAVAAGRSVRFQLPRAVEVYVEQHRLYVDS